MLERICIFICFLGLRYKDLVLYNVYDIYVYYEVNYIFLFINNDRK